MHTSRDGEILLDRDELNIISSHKFGKPFWSCVRGISVTQNPTKNIKYNDKKRTNMSERHTKIRRVDWIIRWQERWSLNPKQTKRWQRPLVLLTPQSTERGKRCIFDTASWLPRDVLYADGSAFVVRQWKVNGFSLAEHWEAEWPRGSIFGTQPLPVAYFMWCLLADGVRCLLLQKKIQMTLSISLPIAGQRHS